MELVECLGTLIHAYELADRQHAALRNVVGEELKKSHVDLIRRQGFQQHPNHLVVHLVVAEIHLAAACPQWLTSILLNELR